MFEGLLLLHRIITVRVQSIDIQRHVPRDTATSREPSLRINDRMAASGSLHELGVLLLEKTEIALRLPVPGAIGREQEIHFLKGTLAGLGVERPDHRQGDDVRGGKDVVGLLVESLEHDGAEQGEPAVTDGPPDDTPGVTLGADLEGEDFSGVEPGDGKPGGAEGRCEQEDHSDGTRAVAFGGGRSEGLVLTGAGETTSEEHSNALDDGAPVQSPTTADAIESEDTDEGCKHVGDGVETGDPLNLLVADTGGTEDGRGVDGDTSNTNPFLHDLEPDDELDTATGVEFARADTEEHGEV